jgi:hypothetical protein
MDDISNGRRICEYVGMWGIAELVAQAEFSEEVAKKLLQKMRAAEDLLPEEHNWMAIGAAAEGTRPHDEGGKDGQAPA